MTKYTLINKQLDDYLDFFIYLEYEDIKKLKDKISEADFLFFKQFAKEVDVEKKDDTLSPKVNLFLKETMSKVDYKFILHYKEKTIDKVMEHNYPEKEMKKVDSLTSKLQKFSIFSLLLSPIPSNSNYIMQLLKKTSDNTPNYTVNGQNVQAPPPNLAVFGSNEKFFYCLKDQECYVGKPNIRYPHSFMNYAYVLRHFDIYSPHPLRHTVKENGKEIDIYTTKFDQSIRMASQQSDTKQVEEMLLKNLCIISTLNLLDIVDNNDNYGMIGHDKFAISDVDWGNLLSPQPPIDRFYEDIEKLIKRQNSIRADMAPVTKLTYHHIKGSIKHLCDNYQKYYSGIQNDHKIPTDIVNNVLARLKSSQKSFLELSTKLKSKEGLVDLTELKKIITSPVEENAYKNKQRR